MFKLNREALDNWLKDLRSGEFKQTTDKLCKGNQYGSSHCCLGVLGTQFNFTHGQVGSNFLTDRDGDTVVLGLSTTEQEDLAGLNDKGVSFLEIADYIEKNISPFPG